MNYRIRSFAISLGIILLSFILLAIPVVVHGDQYLSSLVYDSLHNKIVTQFFIFITNYTLGSYIGPILILVFLLYKRQKDTIVYYILSLGSLSIVRYLISEFIARQRPFIFDNHIQFLGNAHPFGNSFPSGHATQSFFLAYFLVKRFKLSPQISIFTYGLAGLVMVSRVYLGAHYILDVLAGASLGLVWGYISYNLFEAFSSRRTRTP